MYKTKNHIFPNLLSLDMNNLSIEVNNAFKFNDDAVERNLKITTLIQKPFKRELF